MLIRIIFALALIILLSVYTYISPRTFKRSVDDSFQIQTCCALDAKLVEYYVNHTSENTSEAGFGSGINKVYQTQGTLPESLTDEVLEGLGMSSVDLTGITYVKQADNRFLLTYTRSSNNTVFNSPTSGHNLDNIMVVIY